MDLLQKSKDWVVAGLLLGVGFVWPVFWVLGLFGVAYQLHLLSKPLSLKSKLIGSFIAWTIKGLCVSAYYWSTYPMDWLPFDFGTMQLGLIFVYWSTVASFLGLGGVAFALVVEAAKKLSTPRWLLYFVLFPVAWLLAELIGSLSFSFFTYGVGSTININFSLGYVGTLIGEHQALAQMAVVAGMFGLSFVAVFFGVLLWRVYGGSSRRHRIILSIFLILSAVTTYVPAFQEPVDEGEVYTVALIENTFPIAQLFSRDTQGDWKKSLQDAMSAALEISPDYVLLPEDSRFFDHQQSVSLTKATFNFEYTDSDTIIIDSSRVNQPGGKPAILQALILNTKNNTHYTSHKRYLVPQGEFMPYLYSSLFRLVGFGELIDEVGQVMSYEVGPLTSQASFSDEIPGILFCFESSSALGVRTIMNERDNVPFIAHLVSHSWFHDPENFWTQLDTSLRVQAIWNDTYIVSAGSFVESQLFTPRGNILEPELVAEGEYWKVKVAEIPVR